MPDVGLFTATQPLSREPVVIKFSVEVGGLPVYQESYSAETLDTELQKDEAKVADLWMRRLKCVVDSMKRPGFSSSLTRCLVDGACLDHGIDDGNATFTDTRGIPAK